VSAGSSLTPRRGTGNAFGGTDKPKITAAGASRQQPTSLDLDLEELMIGKRLPGLLAVLGLASAVGCGSDGTLYFTFLLQDVTIGGNMVDAYFFVPFAVEDLDPASPPCWLVGFDLKGRSIREVAGERTTDGSEQPDQTYAQYLGDENGAVSGSCLPTLDARFSYGGDAYFISAQVVRGFPDPGSVTITPGEAAWAQGTWTLEGSGVGSMASFWPYEVGGVSTSAVRVYLTEPGR
jgi:hypothetical protein